MVTSSRASGNSRRGLDGLLGLAGGLGDTTNGGSTGGATAGVGTASGTATASGALGLEDVVERRVELVLGVGGHDGEGG